MSSKDLEIKVTLAQAAVLIGRTYHYYIITFSSIIINNTIILSCILQSILFRNSSQLRNSLLICHTNP